MSYSDASLRCIAHASSTSSCRCFSALQTHCTHSPSQLRSELVRVGPIVPMEGSAEALDSAAAAPPQPPVAAAAVTPPASAITSAVPDTAGDALLSPAELALASVSSTASRPVLDDRPHARSSMLQPEALSAPRLDPGVSWGSAGSDVSMTLEPVVSSPLPAHTEWGGFVETSASHRFSRVRGVEARGTRLSQRWRARVL